MIIQCKFDMKELSIGKLSLECQVTDSMKYFLNKRKHLNFSFICGNTAGVFCLHESVITKNCFEFETKSSCIL